MRILLTSYRFHPYVGGIETMSQLFAREFVKAGHEVVVVTLTPADKEDDFPFEVVRRPGPQKFLQLTSWCDVFFQNNISLELLWPTLLVPRPLVVAIRTWIRRMDGSMSWQDHLKMNVLKRAACISNSSAVADHIPKSSTVIGNPYREDIFRLVPGVERTGDLIFVGRLVSDKGVDMLIEALATLRGEGVRPTLTVVGEGPELEPLKKQAADSGVAEQVTFAGRVTGDPLANLLNAHQIMAAPSRWDEPFGIVALEGAACGCVVVGSEGGGLKDAIGPCGVTFPNGDTAALTQALRRLLQGGKELMDTYRQPAEAHLREHTPARVTQRYLEVLEGAAASRSAQRRSA